MPVKTRELPPNQPRSESSGPGSVSPSFAAGQKLGGIYVLRKELVGGERGIWLAHDEVLGKDVSLHFIPQAVRNDAKAMAELRQEVKRNRQLIHPNILRVYDMVEEKEWAAVSMDWFEGQTLANIRSEKAEKFLEPGDVKPWLQQLCQTLGDVHKIQIVHKNLTPSNLILEKSGKLLVMNFGLARVIEDVLARSRKKGESEKNKSYLSPQQLDGEAATASDDIYSAGATIYELLTGEPPFTGKDLEQNIRKTPPMPMMERRAKLGKRGGTILPAWENAVAQCLAKQPGERPTGMYELAAKLGLGPKHAPEVASTAPVKETPSTAVAAIATTPEVEPVAAKKVLPVTAVSSEPLSLEKAQKVEEKSKPGTSPAVALAGPISRSAAQPETASPKVKEAASAEANSGSDIYPSLYPRRSSSPLGPVAAVLAVAAVGAGIYYFTRTGDGSGTQDGRRISQNTHVVPDETGDSKEPGAVTGDVNARPEQTDSQPTAPSSQPSADHASTGAAEAPVASTSAQESKSVGNVEPDRQAEPQAVPPPAVGESPQPEVPREPEMLLAAKGDAKKGSGKAPATAGSSASTKTTAPEQEVPLPPAPDLTPKNPNIAKEPNVAAKLTAAQQARQSAEASDRAVKEAREKQRQAEIAAAEAQKSLDEKAKAVAPTMKVVEDLAAQRKQREEQMKATEAAAAQARQLAEEKARQAEDAKKALAEFEGRNKEKLAARDKAESELQSLRTDLAEKQRLASESAKAVASASEARQQQVATLRKVEDEAAQTLTAAEKAASDEARKVAEQRSQQRQQIEKEIEDMKRLFDEKMKALEMLKSQVAEPGSRDSSGPSSSPTKSTSAPKATPAPSKPSPSADIKAEPTAPGTLALMEEAPAAPVSEPAQTATPEPQSKPVGLENSLGMRFAPIGDVLFCIWPTRIKDFETFAKETKLKSTTWRAPGFKQAPDHPVVNVTWNDAIGFCKWLTERERKSGTLTAGQIYRLPTDLEWSRAVGLPDEVGKTPEDRDMGVPDVFPWGTDWPPPPNVGNYTGEETGSDVAIKGYDDGFAWTSPVGSFPPNRYGLYDMGGNVWQWCMDTWNNESKARVVRGASWYNGALKLSLLSSCRLRANPDSSTDNFGFRIVRASDSSSSNKR